jgi:putative endonuclease
MTNDIERRMYEHKSGLVEGFSKQYNLCKLVYVEEFADGKQAIRREKQLKNWHRDWKLSLIRQSNPEFVDLSESLRPPDISQQRF